MRSGVRRRVKGLSEGEFRQRFGTEAQCRAALFEFRWGNGWACPGCGHAGYAELKGRAVYQRNRCKRQVGLTAGTVFHWTKLPLTVWFLMVIYHLTQSKGGMSSVELARRLGTRQPTAFRLIKHKPDRVSRSSFATTSVSTSPRRKHALQARALERLGADTGILDHGHQLEAVQAGIGHDHRPLRLEAETVARLLVRATRIMPPRAWFSLPFPYTENSSWAGER